MKSRNTKYCSAYHRQLASRKLPNDLLTHSFWYRTECLIKRSPLCLASITGPGDIVDLVKLHQLKAKHQHSYFLTVNHGSKPVPFFPLELSHHYPVSKGGANTARNILIAPGLINRIIGSRIPEQHRGFSGVRFTGETVVFNGSLYEGLVTLFGSQEVNELLGGIKLKRFYGQTPRPLNFGGIECTLPLFSLFNAEIYRLGYGEWFQFFISLKRTWGQLIPFMLELVAAISFYAVLSGDRDRFLFRLRRFSDWFLSESANIRHPFRKHGIEGFEGILSLMIRKYMRLFFEVDSNRPAAVIDFYNRFFSVDVISPGRVGEVICHAWREGKQYSSCTPFFPVPPDVVRRRYLERMGDNRNSGEGCEHFLREYTHSPATYFWAVFEE